MLICSLLQFTITPFEDLYSNISIVIFIPILIFFIFKEKYKNLIMIVIYLLYIVLMTIVKDVGLGIGASFLLIILFILFIDNYKIKKRDYLVIYYIFIILGLWSMLLSFNYKYSFYYNKIIWFNPNTIGLMIMMSIITINTIGLKINKKKLMLWVYNIIGYIGLINIGSRTALLAVTLYLFFVYIVPKFILKKKNVIRFLYIVIILLGIGIPYIYSYMYSTGVEFKIPFSDKDLYTGREQLWIEVIEKMNEEPLNYLFGLGGNDDLSFATTVHNAFFRSLVRYGIIGFLGLHIFFIDKIEKIIRNEKDGEQLIYVIAWLAIMISGFFEVSYMITTFAIPMGLILGLGVSEIKQKEEK